MVRVVHIIISGQSPEQPTLAGRPHRYDGKIGLKVIRRHWAALAAAPPVDTASVGESNKSSDKEGGHSAGMAIAIAPNWTGEMS